MVARWYELKRDGIHLDIWVAYIYMCMLFYMLYLLSSPYLLVIGNDRVRGTREQMMLMQMVLVELSCGEGIARESFIFIFIVFEMSCKPIRVFVL